MEILVNNMPEFREIDYSVTRKEYKNGELIETTVDYPKITRDEYIYENSTDVRVFKIGFIG